jgi:hypothetical protein
VGSTEPAALLVDAMEAFEEGDPKSDENIRSLAASNQLIEAVYVTERMRTNCISYCSYIRT